MAKSDYAIVVKSVRKAYGKLQVLDGIDLKVERGSILALLGPNGAGKTTTVKILATLLNADEGEATIEGFNVRTEADEVRSRIGLTGQYAAVDEFLSGRDNLRMMGRLYHLSKKDAASRTEALLEQFELKEAADRPAKTYSGGMRRRLDLAASLIASPSVMFLDEPTTGLDPRSRLAVWDIVEKLAKSGTTILLTTQYMEEADRLADRVAVIDGGKVIAEGTTSELKSKIGNERVELVFASAAAFTKALGVLDGPGVQSDAERRTISLANDGGTRKLKSVLEKLDNAKVAVDSLSLHKPTLDDVFLQLTGHGATLAEDDEPDGARARKGKK